MKHRRRHYRKMTRFGDGVRVLLAEGGGGGAGNVTLIAPPAPGAKAAARSALRAHADSLMPFGVSDAAEGLIVAIDAAVDELMEELGIGDDDSDEDTMAVAQELLAERLARPFRRAAIRASIATPPVPVEPLVTSHGPFTGRHSHSHSSMGEQGGDATHEHSHAHNGDARHGHAHGAAIAEQAHYHRPDPAREVTDPDRLAAMVDAALSSRGITAATNAAGEVVGEKWHAYLCAEGIRTDDGRELLPGSCRFPDLPVSLRLLIEDDGGHWGAVTAGRIDLMERVEAQGLSMIYAEGMFGSDPNGQLAELLVGEQTQRFVSIDPRDVTAELIEVQVRTSTGYDYDEDEGVYDCWMRVSDCTIGAATILAMPALPQAVIALAGVELPEAPIAIASAPPGAPALVAAGGPVAPPAEWFENPAFHVGDIRLVRQPDGKYACPMRITDDGHVIGHVAYWGQKHTGFPGRNVTPPRSKTGYARFLTGQCPCSTPDCGHAVGQITMGCGHAPTSKAAGGRQVPLTLHEVVAHYDGGYGAVQMADVNVGEDDFGIWMAGAVRPGVTDEDVRRFVTQGPSGDWREMGGALDMLAVLSVPVQGFPIARHSLTASGVEAQENATRALVVDERVVALVAAGVVRPVPPEERIARLERDLAQLHRIIGPFVRDRARARVGG